MRGKLTQLDNIPNNAHDEKTDTDRLADFEEFALVGYSDALARLSARTFLPLSCLVLSRCREAGVDRG